ncbi:MAG: hypothetical protein GTN55_02705, partial [Gammaproteobacteria bacterium]|nr:hypothetical protein [Gammaproteobacteria bacterium]NIT05125.1 hypothetical protein [Gammaproteobacteria bacterium]
MKRTIFTCFIVFMAITASAFGEESNTMKIKISSGNTILTATMHDNATARDFMSMLPLTLMLKDYAS